MKKQVFYFLVFSFLSYSAQCQNKLFRDSLDNKLDVSNFLLHPKGFIPFIQPITEPALGSIGVMGGPVFINENKSVNDTYIPPNITAIMVGYTANNSWFTGGYHMGFIPKRGIKYTLATGYGSINMDFYRTLPLIGERKFEFNFKSLPFMGAIMKQIGTSKVYLGFEYFFMKSEISPQFEFENLPSFVEEKDLNSIVSSPGLLFEFDNRSSIFTPDTGSFFNVNYHQNASWTGSDFDFGNLELIALKFAQFTPNWVSGFRFQGEIQTGNAPFYAKPGILLRGVPMARYQGEQTYLVETEQRYDFNLRWSGVAFGGLAKAIPENQNFSDVETVYNYGTGFRYLIARKFKLRIGIDVAWSNHDFGYYIVFGSAWNQRN